MSEFLRDDINFKAFSYNRETLNSLLEIVQPIFNFKLTTFAYFKFFNNSSRYLYLCNNLKWVEYCLLNVQDHNTSLGKEIGHAISDEYYCHLWPSQPNDELLKALYGFNIWNGLSIFRRSDDFVELWGFATDKNKDYMSDFYLENLDILKKFTVYFNSKAFSLINEQNKDILATYKNIVSDNQKLNFRESREMLEIDKFIQLTEIKKYPIINSQGQEIFLSKREKQCLNFLSYGKTSKEIAKTLELSCRSVELYIRNAKSKMGKTKKSDAISLFEKSCLEWL